MKQGKKEKEGREGSKDFSISLGDRLRWSFLFNSKNLIMILQRKDLLHQSLLLGSI